MARVEIASMPWGVLQDRHGESQNGTSATLKNLDGSNATTWSAVTGGSSSTSSLTADANGNLPRFVEGGQYTLDVPALGVTGRRVEAVSGSVETGSVVMREASINVKQEEYQALVVGSDHTPAFQAAVDAASGGEVVVPQDAYNVSSIAPPPAGMDLRGVGTPTLNHKPGTLNPLVYYAATEPVQGEQFRIRGVNFVGEGQSLGTVSLQGAIRLDKVDEVRIEDCIVSDFADSGINAFGGLRTIIKGNTVLRVGSTASRNAIFVSPQGETVQSSYGEIHISGNTLEDIATAAICIQNLNNDLKHRATVEDNIINRCPGWSGIALEANGFMQDVVVSGNIVIGALTAIFVADTATLGGGRATDTDDLRSIVILGNEIDADALSAGVGINASFSFGQVAHNVMRTTSVAMTVGGDSVASRRVHSLDVVENTIEYAGSTLVNIINGGIMDDSSVSRNRIRVASGAAVTGHGISLSDLNRCEVNDNRMRGTGRTGVNLTDPRDSECSGNRIFDPNEGSNAGATGGGVNFTGSAGTAFVARDNIIIDTRGTSRMTYGIAHAFTSGAFFAKGNTLLGYATSPFQTVGNVTVERHNIITAAGVLTNQGKKETWATAAPVSGTWAVGDVVWNSTPAAGTNIGWVCTGSGTPGTWIAFGLILDGSGRIAPTGGLIMSAAPINANRSSAGSTALSVAVTGAAQAGFVMTADGHISRGPGGSTAPVTLFRRGTGTPEGVLTAGPGSIFQREDGGAGTSFYVKESGTGNTGWVAK